MKSNEGGAGSVKVVTRAMNPYGQKNASGVPLYKNTDPIPNRGDRALRDPAIDAPFRVCQSLAR